MLIYLDFSNDMLQGCQSGRGREVCGHAEKEVREVAILSSRLIRTRSRQSVFKRSLELSVCSTAERISDKNLTSAANTLFCRESC